jgi:hypothetical protein
MCAVFVGLDNWAGSLNWTIQGANPVSQDVTKETACDTGDAVSTDPLTGNMLRGSSATVRSRFKL